MCLEIDIDDIPKDYTEALLGVVCYWCHDLVSTSKPLGRPTLCTCCQRKYDEAHKYEIGNVFQHFKGNFYRICCYVINAHTDKQMILYEGLSSSSEGLFVRDFEDFCAPIDIGRRDNITKQDIRFLWVRRG